MEIWDGNTLILELHLKGQYTGQRQSTYIKLISTTPYFARCKLVSQAKRKHKATYVKDRWVIVTANQLLGMMDLFYRLENLKCG